MTSELAQACRIAYRHEGEYWNAYLAGNDSMEGATLLASVRISLVQHPARREAFITFVRDLFSDIVEAGTGERPQWGDPTAAPEHERSGHG